MTDRRPAHGRPHTRFARACDRLSRGLAWVYDHTAGVFHYAEDWDGYDDNGENISDDLPDVAGRDGWPEPDDGRTVAEAVRDAEAAEDGKHGHVSGDGYPFHTLADWWRKPHQHPSVPGSVTPSAGGPGYIHDDAPTEALQAVPIGGGAYVVATGYNPAELDGTFIEARPEPRAGRPIWAPPHPQLPAWVTDILGAPSVDVYMWNWSQRRAIAA